MRLPIGSVDKSASGGTVTLVGRRGDGWQRVAAGEHDLIEAIALLDDDAHRRAHRDPEFDEAVRADAPDAPRFASGEAILWRYGRHIEAARVVRDDERGLVTWIPSGSARLEPVPSDGRGPREVELDDRFSVPWVTRESTWTGPGILRVVPTGMPWSVWFFRNADGSPSGAYVNLELPHRRLPGAVFTRDLVLDLWIDAGHPGSEDIWLKDADELDAAVRQGRFTEAQAEAVRSLADHAGREFIVDGSWPLDEDWSLVQPEPAQDEPLELPDTPAIAAARLRHGRTSLEG